MDLLRTKGECLIDLPLAFAESEKCQKTLRLLKKALAEIPYDSIGSGEDKGIQQEIYQKEVDLQYCLNFPFTKEYERLFSAEAPGVVLRDLRQPMWDVVEQCMKDGKLLDLRSGALDTSLAEKGIQLQPRKPFSFPPETTGEKPRPGAKILPESRDIAEDHPTTASKDATMEEEEIRGNIAQYQPPSPLTTNETPKFERLPLHEAPHKAVPSSRSAPEPRSYEDSESDGGVVLNLTTNDHESGEISEHSLLADGSSDGEDHSGNDHQGYPIDIRGGTDSGPDDAMLEYSNADQAMNFDGPGPQLETRSVQTYQPSTLAELSERDLREQVKYFYITHDPKTIDFKATPIRCLVCTHPGHMAARCPQLTCAHCGKYNDHSPPFCPATQKCPKCREPGHTQSHCKSKLKVPNSELTCDLCSNAGHVEDDCELLWRTSGLPGVLNMSDTRLKHIFCYECGRRSHLGNDCPTRRPGKPMGTSTWSNNQASSTQHSKNQLSIRSKGELSIKGRAQQQQQYISLDSPSSDEHTSFVRPKVPAPAKTGQIRIEAPRHVIQAQSSWTPPSSRYTQYQEYTSYRASDHSAMSPRRVESGYDSRAYAHQPPLPQGPPPLPQSSRGYGYEAQYESYRPMPSAGQNAWRQFRT